MGAAGVSSRVWLAGVMMVLLVAISGFGAASANQQVSPSPPQPPPPNRDWTFAGGVYDRPVQWKNTSIITVVCTVVIRPGNWLTIEPGTTVRFRQFCNSSEAMQWGLTDPGDNTNITKPSIIIMPGAKLYAVGNPTSPITFEPEPFKDNPPTPGEWGGIIMLGEGRVSYGDAPGHNVYDSVGINDVMPIPHPKSNTGVELTDREEAWIDAYMPYTPSKETDSRKKNETYAKSVMRPEIWPASIGKNVYRKPFVCEGGVHLDCDLPGYQPDFVDADGRLVYGGYRDEGSCGRLEYVRVLYGGGGYSEATALGLFGCGHGTTLSRVEVSHSANNGVTLAGGMAMVKYLLVHHTTKDGVKMFNGYRGGVQYLAVDVPDRGRSAMTVEGRWSPGTSNLPGVPPPKTYFRTHPVIYDAQISAGDVHNETAPGVGRYHTIPIVDVHHGAGLTMGNSIVIATTTRDFGVRVADCDDPTLRVSHFDGVAVDATSADEWISNDRIQLSQNNIIAGTGKFYDYPNDLPKNMLEVANVTFKPYSLENGCQGKLNLANTKLPQYHSLVGAGGSLGTNDTLDPRPTHALHATSKSDLVPFHVAKMMAATKNADIANKIRRHFTRPPKNSTDSAPGAFSPDPWSVWYHTWSTASAVLPSEEVAKRSYAHLRVFSDAACDRVVQDIMIEQGQCYKALDSIVPGTAANTWMKLDVAAASQQQGVMIPTLSTYASLANCTNVHKPQTVVTGLFDPANKGSTCSTAPGGSADAVLAVVKINVQPGSVPSDDRKVDVVWTSPKESCDNDPIGRPHFIFYDAAPLREPETVTFDRQLGLTPVAVPTVVGPASLSSGCYRATATTNFRYACVGNGTMERLEFSSTANPTCNVTIGAPTARTLEPAIVGRCHAMPGSASSYPMIESACGGLGPALLLARKVEDFGPFASYERPRTTMAVRREAFPWRRPECAAAKAFGYDV